MVLEEQLRKIIEEQRPLVKAAWFVPRNCEIPKSKRVLVISGVRRCGKSTFLRQTVGVENNSIHLNFEDPRLNDFEVNDFYKIESIAEKSGKDIFIFDEIQNIDDWEKYVRSAHDRNKKIYVTGSNASLLSKELGTRLTGRYLQTELFPFNYSEFLQFTKLGASEKSYKTFLEFGGFPEHLEEQNAEYLRTLLNDIVIRDIVVRRNIRNEQLLLQLAIFLMSNITKEFSYNNLTKLLEIKSIRTTVDYCDYLQESYLLELIPRFSFSIKKQIGNPKKVYAIDTAMAKSVSLSMTDDLGRMLENAVYIHLRNMSKKIWYFRDDKSECDFIVEDNNKHKTAVQVCWNLTPDNLGRELSGLKNAVSATKASKGIIVTLNQQDTIDGFQVLPAWKWKTD